MKLELLLISLVVCGVRGASVSDSRIWFEGERTLNSKEDVPRARDILATGTNGAGRRQRVAEQTEYNKMTPVPLHDRLGGNTGFSVANSDNGSSPTRQSSTSGARPSNSPGFTVPNDSGSGQGTYTGYNTNRSQSYPSRQGDNSGSQSTGNQNYSNKQTPNVGRPSNSGDSAGGQRYPSRQGANSESRPSGNQNYSDKGQGSPSRQQGSGSLSSSSDGNVYPNRHASNTAGYTSPPLNYQTTSKPLGQSIPNRQQMGSSGLQDLGYLPKPTVFNRRNQTSYTLGVGDSKPSMLWGMPLERVISRGLGRLALDLERVTNRPGNRLFSPISVGTALALILLGAGGNTRQELYQFLGVDSSIDPNKRSELHMALGNIFKKMETSRAAQFGQEFSFACGVFVQHGFPVTSKYTLLAQSIYKAQVLNLDFQNQPTVATSSINRWVSEKTFGRIRGILSEPLNRETRVVIANALYFNGEWQYPFPAHDTKRKPFYVSPTDTVEVDMMVNAAEVYYAENKKRSYRIIGLPYKGGEVVMFIVLPETENNDPRTFVRSLAPTDLEQMANETTLQTVIYTVPKMRLEGSMHLRRPLERLGVKSLFNPNEADLTNLAQGVALTNIFHKVEIEVTETGTKASATTIATLTRDGTTPVFRVDRPFLFFIRHMPTDIITFWGTVFRPSPSEHTQK